LDSSQPLRFSIIESAPPTTTTRQFDLTITTADQTPVANVFQLVVKRTINPDLVSQVAGTTAPLSNAIRFDELTTASVSDAVENCCINDNCQSTLANTGVDQCCGVTEDPLLIRLRHRLSAIIECDEAELDVDTPLENLGFDSMMAIEMLDALEKDFGVKIPTDQFWSGLTLGGLLQRVHQSADNAADTSDDAVQWVEGTL
jgi:acyl carrier protein